MSLLTMVQEASKRLGLPIPTTAATSTDPQVQQLVAFLADEVNDLRSRHDWSGLFKTTTSTVPTTTTGLATVTLPSDFQRFPQNSSIFHVQRRRTVVGPLSSYEWQRLTVGFVPVSVAYWRKVGTSLQLAGVATGDQITFDYISNAPITSSGAAVTAFANDADTIVMPEILAQLGLIWRFRQAKGFDYAEAMSSYERELERSANEDRGAIRAISTTDQGFRDVVQLPPVYVQVS